MFLGSHGSRVLMTSRRHNVGAWAVFGLLSDFLIQSMNILLMGGQFPDPSFPLPDHGGSRALLMGLPIFSAQPAIRMLRVPSCLRHFRSGRAREISRRQSAPATVSGTAIPLDRHSKGLYFP
jgi:hypothetical protein